MTMTVRRIGGGMAAVAIIGIAAGCARHAPPPPPVPAPTPSPVVTPTPAPSMPTINSDIGAEESLWHLRAALNVAALACGQGPAGTGIVTRYNALLTERKAALATAYAAEQARHGTAPGALDRHMTQLYNFFADPAAQRAFCAAAAPVADEVAGLSSAALPAAAPEALARLERPVIAARLAAVAAPAAAPAVAMAAPATAPWRIQIGAFTGQTAAEAAWRRATVRVPSLAGYTPIYQPVPGRPLVRVQVGAAPDRMGAIRLCAAAAAGGFDCMPVGATR